MFEKYAKICDKNDTKNNFIYTSSIRANLLKLFI